MPTTTLTIEIHHLGTETGVWCPDCALPSAITVRVVGVNAANLHTMCRVARTGCECGWSAEVIG